MTKIANVQFESKIFIKGELETMTGLHIGGNSTEMGIGGADQVVVRDPITNSPYIPGSSLRGKMRSLFERIRGEMTIDLENSAVSRVTHVNDLQGILTEDTILKSAKPSSGISALSTKLFGVPIDKAQNGSPANIVPQRLIVRDALLLNAEELNRAKNTDMPMTEVKTEVAIDRISCEANPRQIERVPAGAQFQFEMILNLFAGDDEKEYIDALFQCMELLQDDYLGGHGSRGYGRVKFSLLAENIVQKTAKDYRENSPAQHFSVEIPEPLKPRKSQGRQE